MIRRNLMAVMVVAGTALVAGCASQAEVDQLKTDVAGLRADVNALQGQMQATQDAAMRAQQSAERVEAMFRGQLRK
ncbi:MAG: murein lipoprotein [Rhodospirillales bacterium]|nr:MAG: murein lipoprotein [Rhodospirillales bacterium]